MNQYIKRPEIRYNLNWRNHIRYIHIIFIFLLLNPLFAYSEDISIGKIVKKSGSVKKTNINCDSESCSKDDILIYPGDRIVTGRKSVSSVILSDGTGIEILENSDLIIYSTVNLKNKTLTNIFSDYGKFKIIQQNDFIDASLVFKTRTAIIKTVCATVNIISSAGETGIFVYKGEAGFANIDPSIIDAFAVTSGYESFIKKGIPPVVPRKVEIALRSSWLKRYFLTDDKERILKHDKKSSAIDWFFIEKK